MTKKQLELNLDKGKHGGRRRGAGRRRLHSQGVAHRSREVVTARTPMHINFKYRMFIKTKLCLRILKRAILNARKQGLGIVHFSLQHNHIHLIVEAEDNETLTKGMRSLTVTFARGLKKGKVQLERYHLHVLKTLREARNAVRYVLFNKQRHSSGKISSIDEYSNLLSLPSALRLVKDHCVSKKVTLVIGKNERFDLDKERSYLLRKSLV